MTEKENQEKQDLIKSKNEILNLNKRKLEDTIFFLAEDIKEYQRK